MDGNLFIDGVVVLIVSIFLAHFAYIIINNMRNTLSYRDDDSVANGWVEMSQINDIKRNVLCDYDWVMSCPMYTCRWLGICVGMMMVMVCVSHICLMTNVCISAGNT